MDTNTENTNPEVVDTTVETVTTPVVNVEPIKLTEEEINNISSIQSTYANYLFELGKTDLFLIDLDQEKVNMYEFYEKERKNMIEQIDAEREKLEKRIETEREDKKEQRNNVLAQIKDLHDKEVAFSKEISNKYGAGQIDLKNGTFIPSPSK